METNHNKAQKENRITKREESTGDLMHVHPESPKENTRERWDGKMFEEIMAKAFSNLAKVKNLQI